MTAEPRTCPPGTNLAVAAALMLDGDCGILPVFDDGKLVGVGPTGDMYIALATRNERASQALLATWSRHLSTRADPMTTCTRRSRR